MPNSLTPEEKDRVIDRYSWTIQQMTTRIGQLTGENIELLAVIRELQTDLAEARNILVELQQSAQVIGGDGALQEVGIPPV